MNNHSRNRIIIHHIHIEFVEFKCILPISRTMYDLRPYIVHFRRRRHTSYAVDHKIRIIANFNLEVYGRSVSAII